MTQGDPDQEMKAIQGTVALFEPLNQDARSRVLRYVADRYGVMTSQQSSKQKVVGEDLKEGSSSELDQATFTDIADLYDRASPSSGVMRALVGAYWFQVCQKSNDFDAQSVNGELKHLGHPSTNITRDFDNLMALTPKLVLQVRKEGKTRQARKLYRLTTEGIKRVRAMLAGQDDQQSE